METTILQLTPRAATLLQLIFASPGLTASRFRTANEAEMRLSGCVSTANVAAVADGDWMPIAPYGDHPSPDGSYVQRFHRPEAERVVQTWNSLTGLSARILKNLWHGRGPKRSVPVWDGHPDTDKTRPASGKLLAEVTELRAGHDGLEGRVTWSANGATRRTAGPLYPSPLWWHWPATGEPPTVYPELLESIGLVPTPNISGVPAWTANAHFVGSENFAGLPADHENQNENIMTEQQLKDLRKALGLPEAADAAAILGAATTANTAAQQLTERDTALQTANSARATLETQLSTANSQVTTLTTERDQLRTANGALTGEITVLVNGVLDIVEKRGAITPAERETFKGRLTTANTAAPALTELQTRKAMNTQAIEINGNRVDLTTANARQTAWNQAVQQRMKNNGSSYDEAFAACMADESLRGLVEAMQQPKQAA